MLPEWNQNKHIVLYEITITWNLTFKVRFVYFEIIVKFSTSFTSDENQIVPEVLQAILSLPETSHLAVRYTSTYLLGELCDWIEKHPQFLGKVVYFNFKMHVLACTSEMLWFLFNLKFYKPLIHFHVTMYVI